MFARIRKIWDIPSLLLLRAALALGAHGGKVAPLRVDRFWKAILLVLPSSLLAWWLVPHYIWVISPSIDAWALRPQPGQIRRGDYVSFELSHPLAGPHPVNVTKIALCVPGDRLTSRAVRSLVYPGAYDTVFYCNGVRLNETKPLTKDGRRLTAFAWTDGVIPPGAVFVGSSHPDGFDSRYYGLIAKARLHRMRKLF